MYGADRIRLDAHLAEAGIKGVTVLTVDSSQSAEFKVVFVHLVSGVDTVGFIHSPQRMTVAFSRAEEFMFVVGNFDFLSKHWPAFTKEASTAAWIKKNVMNRLVDA